MEGYYSESYHTPFSYQYDHGFSSHPSSGSDAYQQMFPVRDNSVFQSTPNLAATSSYYNSTSASGQYQQPTFDGQFLYPADVAQHRRVSPNRLILRGVNSNQNIHTPPRGVQQYPQHHENSVYDGNSNVRTIETVYDQREYNSSQDSPQSHAFRKVTPSFQHQAEVHARVADVCDAADVGNDRNDRNNSVTVEGASVEQTDSNGSDGAIPAPPPPPPPAPPIPPGGIPAVRHTSTNSSPTDEPVSQLTAAIQNAKLKKAGPKVDVSGIPPPLVGTKAVLMEEMQRKLAKRKARADGEASVSNSIRSSPFNGISRSNTSSPMVHLNNRPQQGNPSPLVNGNMESLPPELEQLKQELLVEIRQDMERIKLEILAAMRSETE